MLIPAIRAIARPLIRLCALTLALFVARVAADHANDSIAFDDPAVAAKLLDRCHYFHDLPRLNLSWTAVPPVAGGSRRASRDRGRLAQPLNPFAFALRIRLSYWCDIM